MPRSRLGPRHADVGADQAGARVKRHREPAQAAGRGTQRRLRATYLPGKKLVDFSAAFVWDSPASEAPLGITSHFERLSASRCKLPRGASLTCTSCHNPHAAASTATYNQRCQSCHASKPCPQAPAGDCLSRHMPKGAAQSPSHPSHPQPRPPPMIGYAPFGPVSPRAACAAARAPGRGSRGPSALRGRRQARPAQHARRHCRNRSRPAL